MLVCAAFADANAAFCFARLAALTVPVLMGTVLGDTGGHRYEYP